EGGSTASRSDQRDRAGRRRQVGAAVGQAWLEYALGRRRGRRRRTLLASWLRDSCRGVGDGAAVAAVKDVDVMAATALQQERRPEQHSVALRVLEEDARDDVHAGFRTAVDQRPAFHVLAHSESLVGVATLRRHAGFRTTPSCAATAERPRFLRVLLQRMEVTFMHVRVRVFTLAALALAAAATA